MTALASIYAWLISMTLIALWYPILLVRSWGDSDPIRYKTGRLFRQVGVLITKVNPLWRVTLLNTEGIDARRPYVVVANHQSMADIPVLSHLPWEMKWMAKKELFSLPLVGPQLRLAGDIPIDRDNPRDAVKSMRRAKEVLKQKCSVMVFAEGSRSSDGMVGPFMGGAFRLAIDAGVPILPVVIEGTFNCLPKHSWKFGRARGIRVEVLAPILTEGLGRPDVQGLTEQVHDTISQRLAEMRLSASQRRRGAVQHKERENQLAPSKNREGR